MSFSGCGRRPQDSLKRFAELRPREGFVKELADSSGFSCFLRERTPTDGHQNQRDLRSDRKFYQLFLRRIDGKICEHETEIFRACDKGFERFLGACLCLHHVSHSLQHFRENFSHHICFIHDENRFSRYSANSWHISTKYKHCETLLRDMLRTAGSTGVNCAGSDGLE